MTSIPIRRTFLTLMVFGILGFLVYSNTFDVPFHFDDPHVVSDLTFEDMLNKCKGGGSRVICHLTFLLNYWLDGTDIFGYHIFNTLIHIGTAYFVYMFLFLVLSITNSKSPAVSEHDTERILPSLNDPVFWPAFLGGILFLVHPLATQAVTYITQRYTSLAGFFYISSLALFVSARLKFNQEKRFLSGSHLLRYVCSFTMAALAMRTKEMAITLPAAILLTEYYFIQSDFRSATKRILYLLPLLSTGLIIPVSNIVGIETINLETMAALGDYTWAPQITRIEYLLTQFKVIVGIYLKLMFWPIGQNIDHDFVVSKTFFDFPTMASFLALCLILGIGLWLFKRARLVSFGILWFFVTISPTSSIVPNTEFVAEHRVYISLMGLAFAVAGLPAWQTQWKRYILVLLSVLLLLSGLTYARNRVWQTDLTLWEDSVAKSEKRARPHNNLAVALANVGRLGEAISHYSEALKIKPDFAKIHCNFGVALVKQGSLNEAISHYSKALYIEPDYADAHFNLGLALADMGRLNEAIGHFFETLRIKPDYADAHYNLGLALGNQEKINDAIAHYSMALQIKPDFAEAHNNLGVALAEQGKLKEAITHYSKALQAKPDYADAHNNLGNALTKQGKLKEAISHCSGALRIKPNFADAHNNLGNALTKQGKLNEAVSHYFKALLIKPEFAKAHNNLGVTLVKQGRLKEAISRFSEALRIKPNYADAHRNLEIVLRQMGKSVGESNSVEKPFTGSEVQGSGLVKVNKGKATLNGEL